MSDVNEIGNWQRVNTIVECCLTEALLDVLHNKHGNPLWSGLPEDGILLYQRMVQFKATHEITLKKIVRPNQWAILCPSNGVCNSKTWDITIIAVIIQYENVIPPPIGGWRVKVVSILDITTAAYVCRAKNIRNEVKHGTVYDMLDDSEYNFLLAKIKDVLNGLKYKDMKKFQRLKDQLYQENQFVSHQCFEIVSKEIDDDWLSLVTSLNVDDDLTVDVDVKDRYDKMGQYNNSKKITWYSLKMSLKQCNRRDIVKKLQDETNLTEEIENCFDQHRQNMLSKYEKRRLARPFMERSSGRRYTIKDDVYVDLTIVHDDEDDYNDVKKHNERDYHFLSSEKQAKSNGILLDQLVTTNDRYVLVTGMAGIGKSELVNNITFRWAQREILNGENGTPNIQCLLTIKCRHLNAQRFTLSDSSESILRKLFPDLFKTLQIEQLQEISHKIMFIVDGLDELLSIEEIASPTQTGDEHVNRTLQFVRDIVMAEDNIFRHQYIITVARPSVGSFIKSLVTRFNIVKRVQICGFSEENVTKYIKKNCVPTLQKRIAGELEYSESLSTMAKIPVYLWVICNVYRENTFSISTPSTVTELMLYACLVFTRDHLINSDRVDLTNSSFREMCDNQNVLSVMVSLAKLSFISLQRKKIIFEHDELIGVISNVEDLEKQTGLIVKTQNGEEGPIYQFKHLVLQELFAALYVFLSNEIKLVTITEKKTFPFKFVYSEVSTENNEDYLPNLQSCFPIIAGLEGLLYRSKETWNVLKCFLDKLLTFAGKQVTANCEFMDVILGKFEGDILHCNGDVSLWKYNKYISCIYEFNNKLPLSLITALSKQNIYVSVMNSLDLRWTYRFFKQIQARYPRYCQWHTSLLTTFENFSTNQLESAATMCIHSKHFEVTANARREFYNRLKCHLLDTERIEPLSCRIRFDRSETSTEQFYFFDILPQVNSISLHCCPGNNTNVTILETIHSNYKKDRYQFTRFEFLPIIESKEMTGVCKLLEYLDILKLTVNFNEEDDFSYFIIASLCFKINSLAGTSMLRLKELELTLDGRWREITKWKVLPSLFDILHHVPKIKVRTAGQVYENLVLDLYALAGLWSVRETFAGRAILNKSFDFVVIGRAAKLNLNEFNNLPVFKFSSM